MDISSKRALKFTTATLTCLGLSTQVFAGAAYIYEMLPTSVGTAGAGLGKEISLFNLQQKVQVPSMVSTLQSISCLLRCMGFGSSKLDSSSSIGNFALLIIEIKKTKENSYEKYEYQY